jgi:hypothetical protein
MRHVLLFALLLGMIGCVDEPPTRYEETGVGFVRSIDWYHRTFIHETDGGYIKVLKTCRGEMPVWIGMRANIRFHWDSTDFAHCYWIDGVQRVHEGKR